MNDLPDAPLPQLMLRDRDEFRSQLLGKEREVEAVTVILGRADLAFLNSAQADEYRPEAETIVLQLDRAGTLTELRDLVHQQFVAWFDPDTAGPAVRYEDVAQEIWHAVR